MKLSIQGTLEAIKYRNSSNCYTVAVMRTGGQDTGITVVGVMPALAPGQVVKVTGRWKTHPRFGRQFLVTSCENVLPATIEGIRAYLQSGFVKGIGPSTARRIIEHFGAQTIDVIEKQPDRLTEVPGIGRAKAAMIRDSWNEHHVVAALMTFLVEKGLDASYAPRLFREYGQNALEILKTDPFRVAADMPGKGFVIADAIALASGVREDDPARVRACVLHFLGQATASGNLFAFASRLYSQCETMFHVDRGAVEKAVRELSRAGEVVIEEMPGPEPGVDVVWPAQLYEAETGIAARIKAMLSVSIPAEETDTGLIMERVVRHLAVKPSPEQLEVLENIMSHRLVVVTGGPGTGKTTLVRAIAAMFEGTGRSVALAAPTGRAAKRLSEVSGKKATTIHRLLGIGVDDEQLSGNPDNMIDADVIVIDEASMVDASLFYHLIRAVPVTSTLVLVGDVDQLPPVGPGKVLRDLIESEVLPVFFLREVFRQADRSTIIRNAHHVRRGEPLELEEVAEMPGSGDFWFIEENDPDRIARTIVDLCSRVLPETFGFDKLRDIQVITPMHKGRLGTIALNRMLQSAINSESGMDTRTKGTAFRPGDKVMHLKNNYARELFNGDIGTVVDVDDTRRVVLVDYYGRVVEYDFAETDELSLAYAVTVHKAQGSEYRAVVMPLTTSHYIMLERNLLYTAITRARELVVMVGMRKAVDVAMKRNNPHGRLSLLSYRLNPGPG